MPSPTPSSNSTTPAAAAAAAPSTSLRHRTRSWLRSVFHVSPSHGPSTTTSNTSGVSSSTVTPSSFFSFPSSSNHHSADKGKGKRVHKEMGDGYWGLDSGTSEESLEWGGSGLVRGGEGVEGRDWVPGTAL